MENNIFELKKKIEILENENSKIRLKNDYLSEINKDLSFILSNISEIVIVSDYNGRVLLNFTNNNKTPDLSNNNTIKKIFGKEIIDKKQLLLKIEINNIECSIADRSGKIHTILVNAKCVDIMGGSVLYVIRDISEIKQASGELSKSDKRFHKVIDMLPQFVAYTDKDLRYQFVNATYKNEFGLTTEELIGRKLPDVIGQEAFEEARPFVEKALNGEKVRYQARYNYASGGSREIDGQLLPDIADNGQVEGYYAVLSDITPFVAIQKTLEETQQQLLNLFNNLPGVPYQFALTSQGDYRFDFIGEKCSELFGLEPSEVVSKVGSIFELIPAPDTDLVRKAIQQSSETLYPYRIDHRVVKHNGKTKWVHAASVPRKLHNGDIVWDGIALDITERRLAEIALETAYEDLTNRQRIAKLFLTSPQASLFQDILNLFLDQFNSDFGYLGYIDENGDLACPSMTQEISSTCSIPGKRLTFPHEFWGGAWGESLKIKSTVRRNHGLNPPNKHVPINNVLAVPLLVDNQLVGQVALANKQDGFTQEDQRRLESYADFIAPVLLIYINKERADKKLKANVQKLEEKNIALKVLMDNREEEKRMLTGSFLDSFDKLVFPYFERVKNYQQKEDLITIIKIIETNTKECLHSIQKSRPLAFRALTSKEIQVADLIKAGKASKQIASVLNISPRSVYFHRNNIRKKLGIHKTGENLQAYLINHPGF